MWMLHYVFSRDLQGHPIFLNYKVGPLPVINGVVTPISRFLSPGTHLGVSKNRGTPKSSILIGFSIVNHSFWDTPVFGNTNL